MFVGELTTDNDRVRLIKPDVERDAPLSVRWLAGEAGRETLRLMGLPDRDNHESTLKLEQDRIASFLTDNNELDWMIQLDKQVVGAIWIHTRPTEYIAAPAISIMIGDPAARGHGIGRSALAAVMSWLKRDQSNPTIYARHLVTNEASKNLLHEAGFINTGAQYVDNDGLHWQNVQCEFKKADNE